MFAATIDIGPALASGMKDDQVCTRLATVCIRVHVRDHTNSMFLESMSLESLLGSIQQMLADEPTV